MVPVVRLLGLFRGLCFLNVVFGLSYPIYPTSDRGSGIGEALPPPDNIYQYRYSIGHLNNRELSSFSTLVAKFNILKMPNQQEEQKDHWSSKAYTASAPFVPLLTSAVLTYLSPTPTDHILDIGCGDGQLTAQIAASVPHGRVLGLDASASMISTAREKHTAPNCTFRVQDCTRLSDASASTPDDDDLRSSSWDKVFSNAALHWILRAPATRTPVLRAIHAQLKPGGAFVFELGGAGNVAEVHAALVAALVAHGVVPTAAEARRASPWFFPSEAWMRGALREAGFAVERLETEYRPTRLTERGGLEGWVRLMGAAFLERVEEGRREEVVRWVGEVLRDVVTREEDGSRWIGYVRLRGVARKV